MYRELDNYSTPMRKPRICRQDCWSVYLTSERDSYNKVTVKPGLNIERLQYLNLTY